MRNWVQKSQVRQYHLASWKFASPFTKYTNSFNMTLDYPRLSFGIHQAVDNGRLSFKLARHAGMWESLPLNRACWIVGRRSRLSKSGPLVNSAIILWIKVGTSTIVVSRWQIQGLHFQGCPWWTSWQWNGNASLFRQSAVTHIVLWLCLEIFNLLSAYDSTNRNPISSVSAFHPHNMNIERWS